MQLTTRFAERTEALGHALASLIPDGSVIALRGDLAAGKTCLVRGLASAIAPGEAVSSPTFTLVNEYRGPRTLYHLDLYRTTSPREIADLGYEELFDTPDGLCAIEWAERAEALLPARRVDITLEHAGDDERRITIEDRGVMAPGWEAAIQAALQSETGRIQR
ncbi:MAG: tRNA (adenosine(37)-N6)-threonylcarbamoyltransferase complex ATPase subunit type 1 TsaE [Candidatus Hydrogenedentota bacterium]